MQELIIQKGVERQRVDLLPIWVDTHRFHPAHANLQLLRRFGIADDRRVILYSGAVGEKQGLESLLHMAGMAQSSSMTELLFVIAGEGPYLQTLKIQSQRLGLSNVMFMPLLSNEDFPEMLNCAWLHLVLQRDTSGEHFMPSKLYNILSVGGLAMVTADPNSSLGRLVSDHQIAALVPANDPSLLFQRMLDMLETPESNLTLKANARDYANHHLSRDSVLLKYWGHLFNGINN
jgi:colanic acid biosynthesis glycosyl transferase WcaI